MGTLALIDCYAYVSGHDFTTDTNELKLEGDAAALDATTFGSGGWEEIAFGLKSGKFDMKGFWQSAASDAVDPESFTDLGVTNKAHTFGPVETETQIAYLFQAGKTEYKLFGDIGKLAPFELKSEGTDGVGAVRGQLAKAKGVVSATGALGSGLNLGTIASTKYLYATFHVFTAGTTITVVVESDDNSGFTTATTQQTIGPITTRGGTWMTRVAGPLTDTWYRMRVTAITGTFTVAGAIAIGS